MNPVVPITRLAHNPDLPLPAYETDGAAGMDLRAAVPDHEPLVLKPGARAMVPTGLAFAVPPGFEAQVRPRSGLAAKAGVTCLNTPGTVDSDYRGEVKVILINLGEEDFHIRRGDRIAQLIIPCGAAEPLALFDALAAEPALAAGLTFVGAYLPGANRRDWAGLHDKASAEGTFVSNDWRASFEAGRFAFRPLTYFQTFGWLASTPLDAAVFHVSPPDQDGRCSLGVDAWINYGATMHDGSTLGADALLMKGEDVPEGVTVSGNPARVLVAPGNHLSSTPGSRSGSVQA